MDTDGLTGITALDRVGVQGLLASKEVSNNVRHGLSRAVVGDLDEVASKQEVRVAPQGLRNPLTCAIGN